MQSTKFRKWVGSWSNAVVEYWSDGYWSKHGQMNNQHSITPTLRHSN